MDVRGGSDVRIELLKTFRDEKGNVTIGAYVCRYALGSPVSMGTFVEADTYNHGLMVQYSITPGVGTTLLTSGHGNFYRNHLHTIGVNLMYSSSRMLNGLDFIRSSVGIIYNNPLGHSVSLRVSRVPKFDITTIDARVKAVIWSSTYRTSTSTFYLIANASRHVHGSLVGKYRLGGGLGFTYNF